MRVKLKVTRKHIKNGLRRNACHCAIATALFDAGFINPTVNRKYISAIDLNRVFYRASTTKRLRKFIENFDNGQKVKPTSFTVDFWLVRW